RFLDGLRLEKMGVVDDATDLADGCELPLDIVDDLIQGGIILSLPVGTVSFLGRSPGRGRRLYLGLQEVLQVLLTPGTEELLDPESRGDLLDTVRRQADQDV